MKRLRLEGSNDEKTWEQYGLYSMTDWNTWNVVVEPAFANYRFWKWTIADYSGEDAMSDKNFLAIQTDVELESKDIESLVVKVVEHFPGLAFRERVALMHLLYRAFTSEKKGDSPSPAGSGKGG